MAVDNFAVESFITASKAAPWSNEANANWRFENALFGRFIRPYDYMNTLGHGMWAPCAGQELHPHNAPPCVLDLSALQPSGGPYWIHTWGWKREDGVWVPIDGPNELLVNPIVSLVAPVSGGVFAASNVSTTLQPFRNGLNAFAIPPDWVKAVLSGILGGQIPAGAPTPGQLTGPTNLKLEVGVPINVGVNISDPADLGWGYDSLVNAFTDHAAAYLGGGYNLESINALCPGPGTLDPTGTVSDYCGCGGLLSGVQTPGIGSGATPIVPPGSVGLVPYGQCGWYCGCIDPDGLRMRLVKGDQFCSPGVDCPPGYAVPSP